MLRQVLTHKFGRPVRTQRESGIFDVWSPGEDEECSVLVASDELIATRLSIPHIEKVYGDDYGAFLCGTPAALKVACRSTKPVFGLYSLLDLATLPPIKNASESKPGMFFFMDAANIYYYGYHEGCLYLYDLEDPEIVCLGEFLPAMGEVIDEWTQCK